MEVKEPHGPVAQLGGREEAPVLAFRSLLVPLAATSDTRAAVGRALAVAKKLDAHLDVVFVRPDPEETFAYTGLEPANFDAVTQEVRDTVDRHGRQAAERARRQFHAACDAEGVPHGRGKATASSAGANWHVATGEPTLVVPDLARSSDLAIFSGALAHYNLLFENVLEATLVKSGAPVLLLPERVEAASLDRAMLAWDGGTSCARAVSSWLASGFAAGPATVLHISESPENAMPLGSVRTWLARHEIDAEVRLLPKGIDPVGQMLLEASGQAKAGLLVMGGYGTSRYREAIFGGVTRHVIRHAEIPVLMVH